MTTFEVSSAAFASTIASASVFTGTDKTVPVLTCVRVSSESGDIWAEATDRYRAAIVRADVAEVPDFDPFLLSPEHVKAILATCKQALRTVTVTLGGSVAMSAGNFDHVLTLTVASDYGSTATVTLDQSAQWPAMRTIVKNSLTRAAESTPGDPIGLSAPFLASFDKAVKPLRDGSKDLTPLTVHLDADASKPIIVTFGDRFIGLQMPVRHVTRDAATAWATRLA